MGCTHRHTPVVTMLVLQAGKQHQSSQMYHREFTFLRWTSWQPTGIPNPNVRRASIHMYLYYQLMLVCTVFGSYLRVIFGAVYHQALLCITALVLLVKIKFQTSIDRFYLYLAGHHHGYVLPVWSLFWGVIKWKAWRVKPGFQKV